MSSSTDPLQSRILVVDDQESNARLLEFALRRGGYLAVTSTTQPVDVCSLHRQNRYDLILLDLQMPRMNGFDVLAALAGEAPVAVLVLSADPSQESRALASGAKDFLSKPFVLTEVLARVALIMAGEAVAPTLATVPAAVLSLRAIS
ncbi:MAG: two-component system, cell cycle response regulator [Thermoanaerobaculia bacterium]|jgi:DNA-binding response OmpR family regulator|nr:two-component system, cell cycle response regulator [Thermoanaerobaculia bacterium]